MLWGVGDAVRPPPPLLWCRTSLLVAIVPDESLLNHLATAATANTTYTHTLQRVVPAEVARQVAQRWQGLVKLPRDVLATLNDYLTGALPAAT